MLHLYESLTPLAEIEMARVPEDLEAEAAHLESGGAFGVAFAALARLSVAELNSDAFVNRVRQLKREAALREEAEAHGVDLDDRVGLTGAVPPEATVDLVGEE